jgi:hypothetical protein
MGVAFHKFAVQVQILSCCSVEAFVGTLIDKTYCNKSP